MEMMAKPFPSSSPSPALHPTPVTLTTTTYWVSMFVTVLWISQPSKKYGG